MSRNDLAADCLIGIDVGTQSLRALLTDRGGRLRASASRPTPTLQPRPGSAEYDPEALWRTTLAVLAEVVQKIPAGRAVAGIAAASVGESCVLLDAAGKPLGNAIAWFDRRTEEDAAWLAERITPERLFDVTGLALDPTYTLCKLLWTRRVMPERFAAARRMLNIADWIAFRLCGVPATDFSLASRTCCLDLRARRWSADLLGALGLDLGLFPTIRASGTTLGYVLPDVLAATGLAGRPVVGVGAHDHVCGGCAAGAWAENVLLDSMGTAEAMLTGTRHPVMAPAIVQQGYIQGAIERDQPLFYLGGTINSSGGAVEWVRGLLGGVSHDVLIAEANRIAPGSDGVSFLPHLAYSAPPHADITARGAFLGLTAATCRGALFRAVLEGLAMEARLVVDGMGALAGVCPPHSIVVIGGNIRNSLFLEIKASVFGRPIRAVAEPEATALGAALLGGIAAGLWPDLAHALVEFERREIVVDPRVEWIALYDRFFQTVHTRLYTMLQPINARLAHARSPSPQSPGFA